MSLEPGSLLDLRHRDVILLWDVSLLCDENELSIMFPTNKEVPGGIALVITSTRDKADISVCVLVNGKVGLTWFNEEDVLVKNPTTLV